LSAAITDISNILTSSDPLNEKVVKVRDTVQQRVNPLLAATSSRVQEILESLRGKAVSANEENSNTIDSTQSSNGQGN
jgi:hypothetical protein